MPTGTIRANERGYLRGFGTMRIVAPCNGAQWNAGRRLAQRAFAPELIGNASGEGTMMCMSANVIDALLLRREGVFRCQWQRRLKHCLVRGLANHA